MSVSLEVLRAATGDEPAVIVAVIEVEGSTPRGAGSKMAVFADGRTVGTVGGGIVEAVAIERARGLLAAEGTQSSIELDLDLAGCNARGDEAICGGRVRLIAWKVDPAPLRAALARVDAGRKTVLVLGDASANCGLIAAIDDDGIPLGTAHAIAADGEFDLERARFALQAERPCFDEAGHFYDPLCPPERLLILGAGHVGRAIARMAPLLGFSVTIGDPRPALADPARFPLDVKVECAPFPAIIEHFPFGPHAYAVVVSPGHLSDLDCIRAVLGKEYRYAGFIGSRRKVRMVCDALVAEGFDPARVNALAAPIGLDVGAETPEEIAVAVLAEITAYRRASPQLPAIVEERERRRKAK